MEEISRRPFCGGPLEHRMMDVCGGVEIALSYFVEPTPSCDGGVVVSLPV